MSDNYRFVDPVAGMPEDAVLMTFDRPLSEMTEEERAEVASALFLGLKSKLDGPRQPE